ncbi:MAG: pilus assembly protein [Alphaproteobacteria bacterium]|nr:MAG: pilus assembly protein [Alphaproteobacteria bacterium]
MSAQKKIGSTICRNFRVLANDESGSAAILVALSFVALSGFVGLSIDTARTQLVQSRLSTAVDAAGLAAGSTVSTANVETEFNKYLSANFPAHYLDASITSSSIAVNSDKTVLTMTASATVPTIFMRIFNINNVTVSVQSEITRAVNGLELVMVLDNTGSMAGSKLSSLKNAANLLVDILYGGKESVDDLWIGLVPFAQSVNIGSSRTAWLDGTHYAGLNWGPTSWMGCVMARTASNRDTTDDPPSVAPFNAYYWADSSGNDWINGWDGSYNTPLGTDNGPNKYCSQEMKPLTASKTAIVNAINTMQATGNTHVNYGAVWGWRMLSPRWRGLWGGEMDANGLPLDYNAPNMNKAAVIMTDGENTMSSSVFTAYGWLSQGLLGTTSSSTAVTKLNQRLTTVCNAMKSKNIQVYTIAFGNPGTSIKNLLKSCATQSDYYFNSPTETELNDAFRAIGDSLSNLRVSK